MVRHREEFLRVRMYTYGIKCRPKSVGASEPRSNLEVPAVNDVMPFWDSFFSTTASLWVFPVPRPLSLLSSLALSLFLSLPFLFTLLFLLEADIPCLTFHLLLQYGFPIQLCRLVSTIPAMYVDNEFFPGSPPHVILNSTLCVGAALSIAFNPIFWK